MSEPEHFAKLREALYGIENNYGYDRTRALVNSYLNEAHAELDAIEATSGGGRADREGVKTGTESLLYAQTKEAQQ